MQAGGADGGLVNRGGGLGPLPAAADAADAATALALAAATSASASNERRRDEVGGFDNNVGAHAGMFTPGDDVEAPVAASYSSCAAANAAVDGWRLSVTGDRVLLLNATPNVDRTLVTGVLCALRDLKDSAVGRRATALLLLSSKMGNRACCSILARALRAGLHPSTAHMSSLVLMTRVCGPNVGGDVVVAGATSGGAGGAGGATATARVACLDFVLACGLGAVTVFTFSGRSAVLENADGLPGDGPHVSPRRGEEPAVAVMTLRLRSFLEVLSDGLNRGTAEAADTHDNVKHRAGMNNEKRLMSTARSSRAHPSGYFLTPSHGALARHAVEQDGAQRRRRQANRDPSNHTNIQMPPTTHNSNAVRQHAMAKLQCETATLRTQTTSNKRTARRA